MTTPKSKESKRKIRRWEYEIHVTMADGRTGIYHPPALTIGNSKMAQDTARQIKEDYGKQPQFEGATLSVKPIGFETVSRTVLQQLLDIQNHSKVLVNTIKRLVTENLRREITGDISEEDFDKQVTERLGQAVMETQKAMIEEQQAEAAKIASDMGGEVVPGPTLAEEQELEATDPRVTGALETAFEDAVKRCGGAVPTPEVE